MKAEYTAQREPQVPNKVLRTERTWRPRASFLTGSGEVSLVRGQAGGMIQSDLYFQKIAPAVVLMQSFPFLCVKSSVIRRWGRSPWEGQE